MDFEDVLRDAMILNSESLSHVKEEKMIALKNAVDILWKISGNKPRLLFFKALNRVGAETNADELVFDNNNADDIRTLFGFVDSFSINPNRFGKICISISIKKAFE